MPRAPVILERMHRVKAKLDKSGDIMPGAFAELFANRRVCFIASPARRSRSLSLMPTALRFFPVPDRLLAVSAGDEVIANILI